MILIDSVLKKDKNYYLQVFLEECKYIFKEKKIKKYIKDYELINSFSNEDTSSKEDSG